MSITWTQLVSTTWQLEIEYMGTGKNRGRPQKTTTILSDPKTGEVLDVSERVQSGFSPYVIVFKMSKQDMEPLKDVPFGLMMTLIQRMSYSTTKQRLELPVSVQKEIAAEHGISDRTVRRLVSKMEDAGILLKESRGVYQVNPYYFGKGTMQSIIWFRKNFGIK